MSTKSKKRSPLDILNSVRDKAKLDDNYSNIAIRLKAGKIKLQLLAPDEENLFLARTQHVIQTVPDDDSGNKVLFCDCTGDCPICREGKKLKELDISVDDINDVYDVKYPFRNVRSFYTAAEHFLLCARVLGDNADDGSYLPKNSEIGSTHLIQFPKTALNNLMSAYEDFIEDNFDGDIETAEDVPNLFAIFDGEDFADSLTISCRVTNSPYSCTFSFNKVAKVTKEDVDMSKVEKLRFGLDKPSSDMVDKCVQRLRSICKYFAKNTGKSFNDDDFIDEDDLPFTMGDEDEKLSKNKKKANESESVDMNDDDDDVKVEDKESSSKPTKSSDKKKKKSDEEDEDDDDELFNL